MTRHIARILGHDGQVLVQDMVITGELPYIKYALRTKADMLKWDEKDPSPIADAPRIALAYYERTDGGGTRIYRLKVNL